ncbi:MAG TPA: CarD family transcriptional regulator [Candidatus Dependentiae bacterium]|nr:CarD family transcriptional regulator [Candidatus Dependentiae bacterium]HRQ62488.1 CarD family transcriptional regulator [Candidatus Dependentiae bacterium]
MFSLKEKVVYPGHGVAEINRIVKKRTGDTVTNFLELKFINKDMTILVPENNATAVGIRPLSSNKRIQDIFKFLAEPVKEQNPDQPVVNWSKRNKEYQGQLRTGDLHKIGAIYRDLKHISARKELSFGERNLMHQTEALLVEEIAIVEEIQPDQAIERVRSLVP